MSTVKRLFSGRERSNKTRTTALFTPKTTGRNENKDLSTIITVSNFQPHKVFTLNLNTTPVTI